MVVEDPEMDGQEIKRMDYSFDLVSGNVNRVSYQHGKSDQFHHVYSYDADNRIREVFTTETTPLTSDQYGRASLKGEPALTPYWHKDATYSYYQHGPLARTELGGQNVQGIDYIYTIQGWLKGVNSTDLSTDRSYKKDGVQTEFAKDVYSYGLHYFENDYFPINMEYQDTPRMPFAAQPLESFLNQNSSDLYNGNIARMVTTITDPTTRSALVLGNAYRYDQLNRIKYSMSNVDAYDKAKYEWQPAGNAMYDNSFVYDANGNILNQSRYDENQEQVDDLHYQYESGRNRLTSVEDQSVGFSKFSDDIDYSEYQYDPEGRLISDSQENIEDIQWRVDGKVKVILRGGSIPNQKNIIFDYDALGNRIAKHIFTDEFKLEKSTYYVLDATGNVMATYDKEIDYINSKVYLKLKDRSIYGSSRVGVRSTDIDMLASHNPNYSMKSVKYEIGKRTYELSNHLGNVLSVISDKPIPSFEGGNLIGMLADVRVAQDYSPFGVTLSGRSFEVDGRYRYSFQGQEKDDEIKGEGNSYTTEFRQYDPRLGRWLTLDPLLSKYPNQSPYAGFNNNPIIFVDPLGLEGENPNEEKQVEGIEVKDNISWSGSNEPLPILTNTVEDKRTEIINSLPSGNDPYKSDDTQDKSTEKTPVDESSMFKPAKIYFKNVPKEILADIKVIPEDAKSSTDVKDAKNGTWYETDGLWIKGQKQWLKIPDINTVIVTYDGEKLDFNYKTNIWGQILISPLGKQTEPAWVPDSGGTTHITDYPFK